MARALAAAIPLMMAVMAMVGVAMAVAMMTVMAAPGCCCFRRRRRRYRVAAIKLGSGCGGSLLTCRLLRV